MVLLALGAGEHGVVVGHRDALRAGILEQIAVDPADSGDQSVRRGVFHQVVERAAAPLRCEYQRPVLDEGSRVAEVFEVFARGALMGFSPARDRLGPCGVEPFGMALVYLGQVGADTVEVDFFGLGCRNCFELRPLR